MVGRMPNLAVRGAGPVLEKFAATGGRTLGYVAAALLVVFAMGFLIADPQRNRQLILGCVALVLLAWVTLIRPQVAAHANGLVLRNMARDVFIPWGQVRRCKVNQTLQVATDDGHFHGLGVTRSARSVARGERTAGRMQSRGGMFGMGNLGGGGDSASTYAVNRRANQEVAGGSYTDYIAARVLDLARRGETVADSRTRVVWDRLAVAALVGAALCLALIFV